MAKTITVDPVTRIEGHLKIQVTLDTVNGNQQVIDAKSTGAMFRGFEMMLQGRDPLDAPQYTQRICGVCPIAHGLAASQTLEKVFGQKPPANGRILRNLILGANFLQSHILHFYHLAALDYVDTSGILDMPPWFPRYIKADMVAGNTAQNFVNHYLAALEMRRKAHQMGAIFGGKLPCSPAIVPGGCTETPNATKIADFRKLLTAIRGFIDSTYIPDVKAIAAAFPQYYQIGQGCGNLLAYGVFDLAPGGRAKLLKKGRYTDSRLRTVGTKQITEFVKYSWYTANSSNKNVAKGLTEPDGSKTGAYSWIKAPRYLNKVHEVGPLARMYVNGDYRHGISVLDRLMARALEAKKIADAMDGWLNEPQGNMTAYKYKAKRASGSGYGLTEAPRGALGHWMKVKNSVISSYQVISPTGWNASPRDDMGQLGPIEQALIGTPVNDIEQPVEILRVIHSFDPCLSCSVHMVRPDKKSNPVVVDVPVAII